MCGRFGIWEYDDRVFEKLKVALSVTFRPNWNVAPTQQIYVAVGNDDGSVEVKTMQWGLIPFWSKEKKSGYSMINAKAETLKEKPSFRHLLEKKRCVILANAFYEWQKIGKTKQPYLIHTDSRMFLMAGLWDQWNDVQTCTIITTTPNKLVERFHDRMPVILTDKSLKYWLWGAYHPDVLSPFDVKNMDAYPISPRVGSPSNNDEKIIVPLKQLA